MFHLLIAAGVAAIVANQPAGDPAAGRVIARQACGECHAVGRTGASPMSEAPPLRTLSLRFPVQDLEEALAEGISVGHPMMPRVELSSREIADFEAYLRAISPVPRKPAR